MSRNKYLEIIASKLNFTPRHFQLMIFIMPVVFLFYLFMLYIQISASINYIPRSEDADKKSLITVIQKNILYRVEKIFYAKSENLIRHSQTPPNHNPFAPYQAEPSASPAPANNPVNSGGPENSIND